MISIQLSLHELLQAGFFTNFLTKETIELAVNLTLEKYSKIRITKKKFTTIFDLVTSGTPLLFYGKYYDHLE